MSEPMTNHQIEDVLSSIRRLVSDDLRPRSRPEPVPPVVDKLMLTPALRIVAPPDADMVETETGVVSVPDNAVDTVTSQATDDAAALMTLEDDGAAVASLHPPADDEPQPAPDTARRTGPVAWDLAFISRGAASSDDGLETEDDDEAASPIPPSAGSDVHVHLAHNLPIDPDPLQTLALPPIEPGLANATVATQTGRSVIFRSRRDADETPADHNPVDAPLPVENLAAAMRDPVLLGLADPVAPSHPDTDTELPVETQGSGDETPSDAVEHDVAAVTETAVDPSWDDGTYENIAPDSDAGSVDYADLTLDEAAIAAMVRGIIHAELQGALGERITRNVRKLVRAEIQRVLATRDVL